MAIGQVQYAAYGSLGRHSQMPLEGSRGYFEYLARVGFTKHLGSMAATRGLVDLGDIGAGDLALAVGCGLGKMNGYMSLLRRRLPQVSRKLTISDER